LGKLEREKRKKGKLLKGEPSNGKTEKIRNRVKGEYRKRKSGDQGEIIMF
jgi:hypothetical protein